MSFADGHTFKPTIIFHSGRTPGSDRIELRESCGPPVGRRPARPLTRILHKEPYGLKILPAFYIGIETGAETAGPGMCDFPIRREPGAGNRIPGDFFAFFLGRARKKVPPRHERAKKKQTPVGGRHTFKPTISGTVARNGHLRTYRHGGEPIPDAPYRR